MPDYELTFDYNDRPVTCNVVYTMIQDGDEHVPEIQGIYFDEWITETRTLYDDAREWFYSDFSKGLVEGPK